LEPTFKIQVAENLRGKANLVIEISLWGISYAVIDSKKNCHTLLVYHFPEGANIEKAALFIKMSVSSETI
jgi:hypothetical protein